MNRGRERGRGSKKQWVKSIGQWSLNLRIVSSASADDATH